MRERNLKIEEIKARRKAEKHLQYRVLRRFVPHLCCCCGGAVPHSVAYDRFEHGDGDYVLANRASGC